MATYRHTGVSDGTALTDYTSVNQVVDNVLVYGGASAVGTDAYAVSLPISPGAYVAGNRYQFIADVANTGPCTVNFNSIGDESIKLQDGNDSYNNAILANQMVDVEYDGTNFILMNPHTTAFTGEVTATPAELNLMDGVTSTTAELNILDGVTSTAAELNILDGVTSTTAELNILDGVTATSTELNLSDGAVLRHKVIDIGDWNMDNTASVSVAHGLTMTKIRGISALIRHDDGAFIDDFGALLDSETSSSFLNADVTDINLVRATAGRFDSTTYDSTSYNRGWITVQYID